MCTFKRHHLCSSLPLPKEEGLFLSAPACVVSASGPVVDYRTRNFQVAVRISLRSFASNFEQVCAQANSASYTIDSDPEFFYGILYLL